MLRGIQIRRVRRTPQRCDDQLMPEPNLARPSTTHATATMRANRRRDTKPEVAIRSLLHRRGFRFRVDRMVQMDHGRARPDIVFSRARLAVFVDGCYWHNCPEHGELPRANREFWRTKFERNVARDRQQTEALTAEGWQVLRIWEHEDPEAAADRIADVLMLRRR